MSRPQPVRIALVGATGRMGRAIARLAEAAELPVVCAIAGTDVGRDLGELAGVGPTGVAVTEDLRALGKAEADVVIDFSSPHATSQLAPIAAAARVPIVSGTTGLDAPAQEALRLASERVPVLWEPNMSVGIHVLSAIVAEAVAALADWDVELTETHHRAKVDAPSGTALRLAEVAQRARASRTLSRLVHGREGRPGPRAQEEIGVHALRGGDIVGDHTVHLFGGGERLELTHRATSRDVFAHGALRAATWIVGRAPGRYALHDVLAV